MLNFGAEEASFDMLEHSGMPWGMFGTVKARSVNGSAVNEVGSVVDMNNLMLAPYEAVLIKPLEW